MSRKNTNFLDYGIEDNAKAKFDSLISVTVSTVMCLAARCPLPKSNVETTKLFLNTITDDNGRTPRNIKGFLALLNDYSGPFDTNAHKEKIFEKTPSEKPTHEKERMSSSENTAGGKGSIREMASSDGQNLTKRNTKSSLRKCDKEQSKKPTKTSISRVSPSKSVISSKS